MSKRASVIGLLIGVALLLAFPFIGERFYVQFV